MPTTEESFEEVEERIHTSFTDIIKEEKYLS